MPPPAPRARHTEVPMAKWLAVLLPLVLAEK